MRKFTYKPQWSPYWSIIRARNKKEAAEKILKLYPSSKLTQFTIT